MSTATGHMLYSYKQAREQAGFENVGIELPPPELLRNVQKIKQSSPVKSGPIKGDGSHSRRGVPFDYRVNAHVTPAQLADLGKSIDGVEFPSDVWEKWLNKDSDVRTVAVYAHTKLAGYIRAAYDLKSPELATVEDAMVRPVYQGLGVFKRMIELGLEELAEEGVKEVVFTAHPGTEEMYRHLGFTMIDGGFRGDVPPNQ